MMWETVAFVLLVGFSASVGVSGVAAAVSGIRRARAGKDGRDGDRPPVDPSPGYDLSECCDRCRHLAFVPATASLVSSLDGLSKRLEALFDSLPEAVASRFEPGSLTYARFMEPVEDALSEASRLVRKASGVLAEFDADRYAYLLRKRDAGRLRDGDEIAELGRLDGQHEHAEGLLASAERVVDRLEALQDALREAVGDDVPDATEDLVGELDVLVRDMPEYGRPR